jgi:aldehyde dehydrogenase (NAD+)
MPANQVLIAGEWRPPQSGQMIDMVDPSDGQPLAELARGTAPDIDAAVAAARDALDGAWGRMTAVDRGRLLHKLGDAISTFADDLAELEARDAGKPLTQACADIRACARYFEYYGGAADKVHGETLPYLDGYTVFTLREPHGVTGHIIPWNYPAQIFGRTIGGALAMGNATVLKPAEEACLSTIRIAELAQHVGFPPGAINVVPGVGREAGAALAAHPGLDHISFTGSPETGSRIQAAAARHVRPVTLELGGKSPQIVFADADQDAALPFITSAVVQNAGQTCSAGSRLLVEKSIYDGFVARVAERFAKLQAGPWDADLDLGPLISKNQLKRLQGYQARATMAGQKPVATGKVTANAPAGGFYAAPALYADVKPDDVMARQELFGPVLVAMPFADEDEAVRLANGTDFGLVAGVWTANGARQMRMAKRLRCGQVFINNYGAGGGIELPFGGVKKSGFGREKGFEALHTFSVLKTVAVRHG